MEAESGDTSTAVVAAAATTAAAAATVAFEGRVAACAGHLSLHNSQKASTLSRLSSVFLTPKDRIWLTHGPDVVPICREDSRDRNLYQRMPERD